MVEPAFRRVCGGMLLAWRMTSGVVPNFEASEAMLSLAPVILCVVQVDSAWPHCARFRWNFSAFFAAAGSWSVVAGDDRALELRVQRLEFVDRHFGQLGGDGQVDVAGLVDRREVGLVVDRRQVTLYWPGLAMMFFTACSFGT
jgi:hypothetical protein